MSFLMCSFKKEANGLCRKNGRCIFVANYNNYSHEKAIIPSSKLSKLLS